jgi:DNA-binding NarL/FixJ family response regulator
MLRRLRPANLDELGLVAALQELCESWEERSGVPCIFHHEALPDELGDAIDIALYRVTQEALTNVMRHARASAVHVKLGRSAQGELQLSVEDDGQGMDLAAATRGLGLLGATERAAALGGDLRGARVAGRRRAAHAARADAGCGPCAEHLARQGARMIRVLLADDHPVVRSGYLRLLDQAGDIQVIAEAGDADAAYAAFTRTSPTCWSPTWRCPRAAAWSCCAACCCATRRRACWCSACTTAPVLVRRALQAGARGFLTKASPPECLVDAVRELHAGRRYLGRELSPALLERDPHDEAERLAELSAREFEIFRLLAQGHSAGACAEALKLSPKTVANVQTAIKESSAWSPRPRSCTWPFATKSSALRAFDSALPSRSRQRQDAKVAKKDAKAAKKAFLLFLGDLCVFLRALCVQTDLGRISNPPKR